MRVPFPVGIDGIEGLPRTRRLLRNCFNDREGHIIGRPGIRAITRDEGLARGQFVWNFSLYQVVSQELRKVTDVETGAFTKIGDIAGVEDVYHAIGFNDAVLVVKDRATYRLSKDDVLTDITDNPNFVINRDVAHINGRFVYIPSDGDPAYFSDIGQAGTVQPESFFDAEELPDRNNSVWNYKNTLYIGGSDSIELFRDSGASPNPFTRVNGARMTNGTIGKPLEFNETFLFVGREKDQDAGIYAIGQGYAPKISNPAIDLRLTEYTVEELDDIIPGRLKWRGRDIATFTFRNDAFGYYAGEWFELESITDGTSRPWRAGYIAQFQNRYYALFEGDFGVFDAVATDYGDEAARVIDTGFEQENNEWFTCQSVDLGISQGFSDTDGSVALFLSRDGLTYGEPLYRELGARGEYSQHLEWNYPGGMGRYEGFMGMRIYTTEDVVFSADHLIAKIA